MTDKATIDRRKHLLSEKDRDILKEAFRDAIKEAAPDIAAATTEVIQKQLEQAIGRGVIGWIKKFVIGLILVLIGYTYIKTGGPFK